MALFDGNLKQRLIGTIVLIILAVVFLPMIFNNRGEKLPETIVTVPSEPTRPEISTTPSQPEVTTATVTNQAATNTVVTTIPQPEHNTQPVTSTQQTTAVEQNTNTTTPATNTNTQQTSPQTNNPITPSWTIQIAAVSNPTNAEEFTNKLRKANYNAYTRKEGNIYRIFVGPFINKTEAFRTQKLIEKQFKEKGIVREFKPERN